MIHCVAQCRSDRRCWCKRTRIANTEHSIHLYCKIAILSFDRYTQNERMRAKRTMFFIAFAFTFASLLFFFLAIKHFRSLDTISVRSIDVCASALSPACGWNCIKCIRAWQPPHLCCARDGSLNDGQTDAAQTTVMQVTFYILLQNK